MIRKGGVAFFDSGLGGLNILNDCLPFLSDFPVYYYGDNAFAPYGNKRKAELSSRVHAAFELFSRLQVTAAVVACNTVTALFLEELQASYPFPIVGTTPVLSRGGAAEGELLVLATSATVSHLRARAEKIEKGNVRLVACKELAGEIERHLGEQGYDFTPFFPKATPSAVALGCTHYAFLRKQIETFYGCKAIDAHAEVAAELVNHLPACPQFPRPPRPSKTKKFPSVFPKNPCLKRGKKRTPVRFAQPLYFLGESASKNAYFYKRMFVFNPKG